MGAALAIIITFSLSVFIVRLATVALQITGLSKDVAKFQALSAYSGAGYTTAETEQIVNFPLRRKIVTKLMVIGNLGAVAIFSTLVVGFVRTEGDMLDVLYQLMWFTGAMVLVWVFLLSAWAERYLHKFIRKILLTRSILGHIPYETVVQVGKDWSIAEHKITHDSVGELGLPLESIKTFVMPGHVIAVKCQHGVHTVDPSPDHVLMEGESFIILALNDKHREISETQCQCTMQKAD